MDPPLDTRSLVASAASGNHLTLLLFWGHRPKKDGSIGQSCLSQWYAASFSVEGIRYPTAEHYMMAEKARLFGDDTTLADILDAPDPKSAKALGRKVRNFHPATWEADRFEIVVRGNHSKFSHNAKLRDYLLSTDPALLVEASPYDQIWGIGLKANDPRAQDPAKWRGLNLLGFALVKVREMLKTGAHG